MYVEDATEDSSQRGRGLDGIRDSRTQRELRCCDNADTVLLRKPMFIERLAMHLNKHFMMIKKIHIQGKGLLTQCKNISSSTCTQFVFT